LKIAIEYCLKNHPVALRKQHFTGEMGINVIFRRQASSGYCAPSIYY